jgi:ABC-2 type transport system ATP-binding protein
MSDLIELQGLTKSFHNRGGKTVRAVRNIDVSIARGETVALLGPNGAGKSTTIDMLLGLAKPDSGSVSVFGSSPARAVDAGWVGGMLQTGTLIRDLTVRELVTLMASLYPRPLGVEEAIQMAGMNEFADQRTNGLSGGQSQRVRLANALVSGAQLLVLDEPTVALDVSARREFWVTVRAVAAEGKTVIFATHYLEEADANADRVVLMAHGRVVADGSTTEIKARASHRTIRATLPGADTSALRVLAGVNDAERHGEAVILHCNDSDAAIRALIGEYPQARDFEIQGAALEDAFIELTSELDDDQPVEATR